MLPIGSFENYLSAANDYFISWNQEKDVSQQLNQPIQTSTEANSISKDYKNEGSCVNNEEVNLSHSDVSIDSGSKTTKKKTPMCLVNELARHHKVYTCCVYIKVLYFCALNKHDVS